MNRLRVELLMAGCVLVLTVNTWLLTRRVEALERRVPITVTVHGVPAADVPSAVRGLLPELWEASEAR